MAADPVSLAPTASNSPELAPFRPELAALVASWIQNEHEAFWLAPRTRPPIDARKVLDWAGPGIHQLILFDGRLRVPVAYGEVNLLAGRERTFWLGHLLVDPVRRGGGMGRALTEQLLRYAFARLNARRVTLVVFPENAAAIACYLAAGLRLDGHESHYFPTCESTVRMVRMAVMDGEWRDGGKPRAAGAP